MTWFGYLCIKQDRCVCNNKIKSLHSVRLWPTFLLYAKKKKTQSASSHNSKMNVTRTLSNQKRALFLSLLGENVWAFRNLHVYYGSKLMTTLLVIVGKLTITISLKDWRTAEAKTTKTLVNSMWGNWKAFTEAQRWIPCSVLNTSTDIVPPWQLKCWYNFNDIISSNYTLNYIFCIL